MEPVSPFKRTLLVNLAALAWIALLFQFYLIIVNRVASIPETIIRFFSYFTILSNILVALCATYVLLKPNSRQGMFFARPQTQTAIALYIGITGIIYNIILRSIWKPQGLALVVNELLHSIVPALFIVYWIFFVTKKTLQWKNIFPWLIFPTVYCVYSLIRGTFAGFYPYPFLDVTVLGYNNVFINIALVSLAFILLSLLLVGVAKLLNRNIDHIL